MPQDIFDRVEAKLNKRPLPPEQGAAGDIFDRVEAKLKNQPRPQSGIQPEDVLATIGDIREGVGKGAISTMLGLTKLTGRIPGVGKYIGVPGSTTLEDLDLAPTNTAQKIGMGAEQVGEFFIPAGVVSKGAKAVEGMTAASKLPALAKTVLNVGARAGLEAGAAGAVTAAQTGGDAEATRNAALIAGAIPVAGKIIEPAANAAKAFIAEKLPGRLIESLIKPSKSQMRFGRTPGQEVAVQGLKANSLEGLEKEISQRKNQLGSLIDKSLGQAANSAKRVDVAPAINGPIDEAINLARTTSGNRSVVSGLEDMREALLNNRFDASGNVKSVRLSPLDARKLKTDIGDVTRWTEDPIEGTLNEVRQKIYRNLNELIDNAVPGTKEMNAHYANLLTAEKAINARIDAVNKLNIVGLTAKATGVATAVATFISTGDVSKSAAAGFGAGLTTGGLAKLLGSTPALSRAAVQFASLSPAEKTAAAKAVPLLRNIYLGTSTSGAQNNGRQ